MKNNHNWSILEKLASPATTAEERIKLLRVIESDPVLLDQWKAFRILQKWPNLEQTTPAIDSEDLVIARIEEDASLDTGIKRNFPWVAAVALAASVVLVFINIGQREDSSDITLDDVFGLPAPTIENTLLANL